MRTSWKRFSLAAAVLIAGATLAWATGTAGLLDPTFGTGGVVVTTMNPYGILQNVAIQSDGKIVAVGQDRWNHPTEHIQWTIHRYDTSGGLDASFGTNGRVTLFGDEADNRGADVEIDGSGRILVTGYASRLTGHGKKTKLEATGAVVRLTSSGALDTTFGDGGIAYVLKRAGPVALETDGDIVVAGAVTVSTRGKKSLAVALARLDANGDLDSTFGDGGIVVDDLTQATSRVMGSGDDIVKAIGIQSDGKIVVAGRSSPDGLTSNNDQWLVRYGADGSVDSSFGTNGMVLVGVSFTRDVWRIAIDANDDILVSGYGTNPDDLAFVQRFDADGSPVASFGTNGEVVYQSAEDPLGGPIALRPDGKIVVAVDLHGGTDADVSVLRLNADGSLDSTFGTGGLAQVADGGTGWNDSAYALALGPGGDIVVAGPTVSGSSVRWILARYTGD